MPRPAGFRVSDGQMCGLVRLQPRSREFSELLGLLDQQAPPGQPIHLIPHPVSSHHSAEVRSWLAAHPERRFVFHFLPIHASWLSFIEVWFSILSRKCLRRADFPDASVATERIEAFITTHNTHLAHPFTWTKGIRFYQRPLPPPMGRDVVKGPRRLRPWQAEYSSCGRDRPRGEERSRGVRAPPRIQLQSLPSLRRPRSARFPRRLLSEGGSTTRTRNQMPRRAFQGFKTAGMRVSTWLWLSSTR